MAVYFTQTSKVAIVVCEVFEPDWDKRFNRVGCIVLCLALLSAVAIQALAQSSNTTHLSGVVIDQNDAPILNATVVCGTGSSVRSAHTDDTGHFELDCAIGQRQSFPLRVTANGFSLVEREIDLPAPLVLRLILTPAQVSAKVTIAATRMESQVNDTPTSVAVINQRQVVATPALAVDDILRQVAGFSLFRRAGSRTANPTTQGVSLRGLGASGASRAIVLADGFPLNDVFGGWIYWDRIPRESIKQVEVVRGPASHLYGSGALSGVISIATRELDTNEVTLETSYGNERTPNASIFATARKSDWAGSIASELYRTDGYIIVNQIERGPVDINANSRHGVVNVKIDRRFGKQQHVFGGLSFFGESRNNGTPLQTNRTHIRQFSIGGAINSLHSGDFSARGYGGTQVYDQNFSAVAIDRSSETITRVQRVPAQFVGFSAQWSKPLREGNVLALGYESQQVRAASDERAFTNGRATSLVGAGGRQRADGVYVEDIMHIGSQLIVNGGARFDFWRNIRAAATTTTLSTNNRIVIAFPDRSETAISPRLSGVFKLTDRFSIFAGVMRAFRAPTLNELYRSFRVGSVLTLANENLRAERLTGGESGFRFNSGDDKISARGTFFWNEVTRPVANVTLATSPSLITRQRQNLGRIRSRGFELDVDSRFSSHWFGTAGYLLADATVTRFPANRALEGLAIPQVAKHQLTFQLRYDNPSILLVSIQARTSSQQYDDDQNLFWLAPYFNLDMLASRRLSSRIDAFLAIENIFNQRYETGKTPVTTLGPPLLIRAGFKIHLSSK